MLPIRIRAVGDVTVPLPAPQTAGSAGIDLAAALSAPITLQPGERKLVPTGWAIAPLPMLSTRPS